MALQPNVGGWDRILRLVVALILASLAAFRVVTGPAAVLALVVAAIALVTALVRFCPANLLLGINSCPAPPKRA